MRLLCFVYELLKSPYHGLRVCLECNLRENLHAVNYQLEYITKIVWKFIDGANI